MNKAAIGTHMEKVVLYNDNGAELQFSGKLYSESSFYAEDTGTLTRLRLFITDKDEQVYSIVNTSGVEKSRRFYVVSRDGDMYRISNGAHTIALTPDLLFASVFGLCGIDPDRAEELKPEFEETLRMIAG
ncbi:MAG: hypothetical protein LBC55_02580 [Desulfovibrio sp.]|nr:hypothetical protein [Desulfovibrio sp.]